MSISLNSIQSDPVLLTRFIEDPTSILPVEERISAIIQSVNSENYPSDSLMKFLGKVFVLDLSEKEKIHSLVHAVVVSIFGITSLKDKSITVEDWSVIPFILEHTPLDQHPTIFDRLSHTLTPSLERCASLICHLPKDEVPKIFEHVMELFQTFDDSCMPIVKALFNQMPDEERIERLGAVVRLGPSLNDESIDEIFEMFRRSPLDQHGSLIDRMDAANLKGQALADLLSHFNLFYPSLQRTVIYPPRDLKLLDAMIQTCQEVKDDSLRKDALSSKYPPPKDRGYGCRCPSCLPLEKMSDVHILTRFIENPTFIIEVDKPISFIIQNIRSLSLRSKDCSPRALMKFLRKIDLLDPSQKEKIHSLIHAVVIFMFGVTSLKDKTIRPIDWHVIMRLLSLIPVKQLKTTLSVIFNIVGHSLEDPTVQNLGLLLSIHTKQRLEMLEPVVKLGISSLDPIGESITTLLHQLPKKQRAKKFDQVVQLCQSLETVPVNFIKALLCSIPRNQRIEKFDSVVQLGRSHEPRVIQHLILLLERSLESQRLEIFDRIAAADLKSQALIDIALQLDPPRGDLYGILPRGEVLEPMPPPPRDLELLDAMIKKSKQG